ncbi:MAG: exopolysaccharide biosynthesis polyprenyl glycosylphosphotransferase [Hyphomicrobiaceae bacterium]
MTASPFGPGSGSNVTLHPSLHRFSIPSTAVGPIFVIVEFLTLSLAPYLGSLAYHAVVVPDYVPPAQPMLTVGVIMAALYLVLSNPRGPFEVEELRSISLRAPLVRWLLALMFFGVVSFSFKMGDAFSRGAIMVGFMFGATALVGLRLAAPYTVNMAFRHNVVEGRRAILLSDGPLPPTMSMHDFMQCGISVHGWFQLPAVFDSEGSGALDRQCAEVVRLARERRIDEIVLVANAFREPKVADVLERLNVLPLRIRLLPRADSAGPSLRPRKKLDLGAMALTVQRPPFTRAERRAKRALDVLVASTLLLAASPLLALIAIAIRLDSRGPVLFRQTRIGFGGRPFMIFKFRSMYTTDNGPVVKQAERGDVRITRVGRLLRETSLDELPQLLNVIVGDMSLVGPRPHAVAHDRHYEPLIPGYAWRHHALPGITGWAQVSGLRGETRTLASMEARVAHDLWYIRNWSLWLDLKVLMMTIKAVLRPTNAY